MSFLFPNSGQGPQLLPAQVISTLIHAVLTQALMFTKLCLQFPNVMKASFSVMVGLLLFCGRITAELVSNTPSPAPPAVALVVPHIISTHLLPLNGPFLP